MAHQFGQGSPGNEGWSGDKGPNLSLHYLSEDGEKCYHNWENSWELVECALWWWPQWAASTVLRN